MNKTIYAFLACGSALCATSSNTMAQSSEETQLGEVIVTAQRREQTLLDVPISVAVYSAELIEQNAMKGARDFILMTPNMTYAENDRQSLKNGHISIRGMSDLTTGGNETVIQSRSAVAYTVDDFNVSFIATGAANPPLNDVERIEILRGPQGTYFGRNATGGAVNLITKKPGPNGEAQVSAAVGNFGTYRLGALANVPISENFFVRGSVSYDTGDGYVENLSPTGNDGDYDYVNMRLAARWLVGDWTFDLAGQRLIEDEGSLGSIGTGVAPTGVLTSVTGGPTSARATCGLGAAIFFQNGNDDKNCMDQPTYKKIENDLFTLRARYTGERVSLTSITGRIDGSADTYDDIDKTGVDAFNRKSLDLTKSFSQEVQLASEGDWKLFGRPLTWLIGGLYYHDEADKQAAIIVGQGVVPGFIGVQAVPGDHPNENHQFVDRKGNAAYFDVSFDVADKLTLSLGGRYSKDKDHQYWTDTYASFECGTRAVINGVPNAPLPGCAPRPDQLPLIFYANAAGAQYVTAGRFAQTLFTDARDEDSDFSPRVALSWKALEGHNIYATWSQGYRAGGVRVAPDANGRAQQVGTTPPIDTRSHYDKEQVTNYEIGWKGYFNDRRTRFEIALFRMDWDDMQVRLARFLCRLPDGTYVPANDPASVNCVAGPFPDNRVQNAKSARSEGAELSIQSLLGTHFEVGAALGLLDAKFTDFRDSAVGDITGKPLPNSPDWTAAVSAQYNWAMGSGTGYLRLEGTHRENMYTRLPDVTRLRYPYQLGAVTLANLRAGLQWSNHSLSLSVDNLFDKEYTAGADDFSGVGAAVTPHPRVMSLGWSMKLGL